MNRPAAASRGYMRPMQGWWRRDPFFIRYMAREATALAVLCYSIILAVGVVRLAQGEAAWNAFLPTSLPLAAMIGLLGVPTTGAAAWLLRSRKLRSGPLGTLALGVGCGLAVATGFVVAVTTKTTCSSSEFERFSVACDRV